MFNFFRKIRTENKLRTSAFYIDTFNAKDTILYKVAADEVGCHYLLNGVTDGTSRALRLMLPDEQSVKSIQELYEALVQVTNGNKDFWKKMESTRENLNGVFEHLKTL